MENKFMLLKEEEKEFLFGEMDGQVFDNFNIKIDTLLYGICEEYNKKFNANLSLIEEDLEDLFEVLELRWCENCGKLENIYNGGGTANDMTCCDDCYNHFKDDEENDED